MASSMFRDDGRCLPSLVPVATRREKYNRTRQFHFEKVKDPLSRSTNITKTTLNTKKTSFLVDKELKEISRKGQRGTSGSLLTSNELEAIKISSRAFKTIIDDCVAFKKDLLKIKRFYDNYLDELLRSPKASHDPPILHMPQDTTVGHLGLGASNIDSGSSCDELKRMVTVLTDQIMFYTTENERLQKQLTNEISTSAARLDLQISEGTGNAQSDYASKVNNKQYQLYKKHEEISDSVTSRNGLVPHNVCQRLEQCIRSNELELQKLLKDRKRLKQELQSLEIRLRKYLEAVKTPPSNLTLLWGTLERNGEKFIEGGE